MHTFCTIITSDYAQYALAFYRSYRRYADIPLQVLCVDRSQRIEDRYEIPDGMHITYMDPPALGNLAEGIAEKYRDTPDILRWSLKPVWIRHLLSTGEQKQVIYCDPDMCFFADPGFLFQMLDHSAILLSPHWRSMEPMADPVNFELNFRDGIYNGGCIGAAPSGIPALEWLARACLYKCERTPDLGLFVDQKYLDLLAVRFEGVAHITHRGCNVANWNQVDCRRVQVHDSVQINGQWPVVFIHFTGSTIRSILNGSDGLLVPFLRAYEDLIREIVPAFPSFVLREAGKSGRSAGVFHRIAGKMRSHTSGDT